MEKIFLSQENIINLTKKLILYLELDESQINREVIIKCKKIISNYMNAIFDKYCNKKPPNISSRDFLEKLNKKSLSDCIRMFEEKKQSNKNNPRNNINNNLPKYNQQNNNQQNNNQQNNNQQNNNQQNNNQQNNNQQNSMLGIPNKFIRPDDMMNRMTNNNNNNFNKPKEYTSYNDGGGAYASFSSLNNSNGPFITATGEYGLPLEMQNENSNQNGSFNQNGGFNQNGSFNQSNESSGRFEGRKNFSDELEKRMNVLQTEYRGGSNQSGPQLDEMTAKLLNLNNTGAQLPAGMILPPSMQSNNNNKNMGNNNNMNNNNMNNNTGNNTSNKMGNNINTNTDNKGSGDMGYSFEYTNDDIGNDFNQAYGGQETQYNGVDSFENNYKLNSEKNLNNSDTDLDTKLKKMEMERSNINSKMASLPKNNNFDPMKSPNMNQKSPNMNQKNPNMNQKSPNMNQKNPNMNQKNDDFFFLNDSENKKKEVVKQKQTKEVVKQKQTKEVVKQKQTKEIVKQPKSQKNSKLIDNTHDINLDKEIEALEASIRIDEEKKLEEKKRSEKDSKKALIKLLVDAKKNKETDIKSDTSDIFSEKENFSSLNKQNNNNVIELDIKKKNKNNNISINDTLNGLKQDKLFEEKIIEIHSNKVVDSECFNDYMINFENKIRFRDININSIQLPRNTKENIIEGKNNSLKIVIDNKEHIIELEENYYNRNEICFYINEAFQNNSINIKCGLVEDNFIFKSQERFNMINETDSILPYLGFNKNSYLNRNEYKSTNILKLGDNIFYLVIENICREPLFLINNDNDEIKKLIELNENYEVDHLIIKFYRTRNEIIKNDLEYKFFFEKEHKIVLNFT
jgi:hypothetical protein